MRHRLGKLLPATAVLAAVLTTAGCGSSSSSTSAQDPGASSSTSPSGGPSSPAGAKVHLFSLTGGGGVPSTTASPLNTPEQVAAFGRQFRAKALGNRVEAFTSRMAGAGDLEGAVIAVGCDRPPGAAVQVDGGTVTITPYEVESPLEECLAAVTTVAVAVIPQG